MRIIQWMIIVTMDTNNLAFLPIRLETQSKEEAAHGQIEASVDGKHGIQKALYFHLVCK
jgi:hypothetical protein